LIAGWAGCENLKNLWISDVLSRPSAPICVGNYFGVQESLQVAMEINRRFELRLAPGTRAVPELGITLLPREGTLRLEYQRRH